MTNTVRVPGSLGAAVLPRETSQEPAVMERGVSKVSYEAVQVMGYRPRQPTRDAMSNDYDAEIQVCIYVDDH